MTLYSKSPQAVFEGTPADPAKRPINAEATTLLNEAFLAVQAALDGINRLASVDLASTGNITLSAERVVDGVTTTTSRVLVKDQTDPTENGVYVSGAGAWTRAGDADTDAEIAYAYVHVIGGSTQAGTSWQATSAPEIGVSDIAFAPVDLKADLTAHIALANPHGADTDDIPEGAANKYATVAQLAKLDGIDASAAGVALAKAAAAPTIHADIGAGRAAVADTQVFSVFDATGWEVYRRDSASTQTLLGRIPLVAVTDALAQSVTDETARAVAAEATLAPRGKAATAPTIHDGLVAGRAAVLDGEVFAVIGVNYWTVYRRDSSSTHTDLLQLPARAITDGIAAHVALTAPEFATTAAGRDAVADGARFSTRDLAGVLTVWERDDGAPGLQTLIYQLPTTAVTNAQQVEIEVLEQRSDVLAEPDVDVPIGTIAKWQNGYRALGVDPATGALLVNGGIEQDRLDLDERGVWPMVTVATASGTARAFGVEVHSGLVDIGPMVPRSVQRLAVSANTHSDLWHVTDPAVLTLVGASGQSLSVARIGENPPSDEPAFYPLFHPRVHMVNTGVRGTQGVASDPDLLTHFTPAAEEYIPSNPPDGFGHTPLGAAAHWIAKADEAAGTPRDLIARGWGKGGQSIAELQRGSQAYANMVAEVAKIAALALAKGRRLYFPALFWTQGEDDRKSMTRATYAAHMDTLVEQINEDILPLLPVGHPPIRLIADQVSGSFNGTNGDIGFAQADAAASNPLIHLSGPKYKLRQTDNNHLGSKGSALLGEMQGRAWYEIVARGNTAWRPLQLASATRASNKITVTLDTLGHDIAFDTTSISAAPNMGLVYDSTAAITAVTILDASAGTIQITLDGAQGGTLTYAHTTVGGNGATTDQGGPHAGCYGNIRDTAEYPSQVFPGEVAPNWLVSFTETIA